MISASDRQRRPQPRTSSFLATSAAIQSLTPHPFRRHSMESMRLLKGSSSVAAAAAAAAITTVSISELPSKISPQTQSIVLSEDTEKNLLPSQDFVASASLPAKLIGDVAVAIAVTFGVSPFLAVVDKAIVESANGSKPILTSARDTFSTMIRHPVQYIKSPTFLLMWAVYGATYSTANVFKTLDEHQSHSRARHSTSNSFHLGKVGTFLGTTMVNSGASMLKDRAYARMFSSAATSTASKSFPKTTYAMWMMRDLSVIGSSFILPDIVSKHLVQEYNMESSKAQSICQLALPVAAQFIAGPFHFLGLDFFNRQHAVSTFDRARALHNALGPVVAARIARIAPGYGIGGVWNTKLRTAWREEMAHGTTMPQQRRDQTPHQHGRKPHIPQLLNVFQGEKLQGRLA